MSGPLIERRYSLEGSCATQHAVTGSLGATNVVGFVAEYNLNFKVEDLEL